MDRRAAARRRIGRDRAVDEHQHIERRIEIARVELRREHACERELELLEQPARPARFHGSAVAIPEADAKPSQRVSRSPGPSPRRYARRVRSRSVSSSRPSPCRRRRNTSTDRLTPTLLRRADDSPHVPNRSSPGSSSTPWPWSSGRVPAAARTFQSLTRSNGPVNGSSIRSNWTPIWNASVQPALSYGGVGGPPGTGKTFG